MLFNSLPNDNILDVTQWKAFVDYKSNVAKMTISLFDELKTLWEKGNTLVTSIFSFSAVFSKACFFKVLKSGLCVKALTFYHAILTFNDPNREAF